MSRGPNSAKALAEALAIAGRRGSVILIQQGRESPCNFQIVGRRESVFVTVKMSRNIRGSAQDFEARYREDVFRLRMIFGSPNVRKELWVRSRYGRWRFFEITDTGIAEVLVAV